jgi:cell division transport system ATP-binding protein
MALINYRNVNVYQESMEVLHDVTFTVGEGEFIYLTGKVGSGKSSLLKTLYAEIPVKEGLADVLGFDMTKIKLKKVPELRRKLGIIFQDFQLLTDRTVEANLRFVLKATGWKNKHDMEQRIKDVLELVGMSTKGYKMPNELSGGEQQRISIARAILNKPKLILADEPTGNLDVETSNSITELLQNICKAGSTVIMITHNMNLLARYPGKVFKCEDHRVTEITTPVAFDLSSLEDEVFFESSKEEASTEVNNLNEQNASDSTTTNETSDLTERNNKNNVNEQTINVSEQINDKETNCQSGDNNKSTAQEQQKASNDNDNLSKHNLKPINLDDFRPSDITDLDDIIKQHSDDTVID